MVSSIGFEVEPFEWTSVLGFVGLDDVDRAKVSAVVTRKQGRGEPDFLRPEREAPVGITSERWVAMEITPETSDEEAIVLLGDSPDQDLLLSTTWLVIRGGPLAYALLPSLSVVCPFKPGVLDRFPPGQGRGKLADEFKS